MRLKPQQAKKLARLVFDNLARKNLIKILSSEKLILDKIEGILWADVKAEEEIETAVKKTMEKLAKQVESGEIDYHKMYGLIKKQLMKEKKFIP